MTPDDEEKLVERIQAWFVPLGQESVNTIGTRGISFT